MQRRSPSDCESHIPIERSQLEHFTDHIFHFGGGERSIGGAQGASKYQDFPCFQSESISYLYIAKKQYIITPKLLVGTPISELKRAKLRFWIYQESTKLKLDRTTVAVANYLIDLYFSKGGTIALEDFQSLGIAALLLSDKTHFSKGKILFDQNIFPTSILAELQLKICTKCCFMLHPTTYVHIMNELLYLWNRFASKHSDLWFYDTSQISESSFSSQQIYQILDTIYLVTKTFNFSTLEICLHVLRKIMEEDYKIVSCAPKSIEDEVVISFWYNPQNPPIMNLTFPSIFLDYLKFVNFSSIQSIKITEIFKPNNEAQFYVQSFFTAGFNKLMNRSLGKTYQANQQSFNSMSWQISKYFLLIKKNARKESTQTLSI